MTIRSDAMGRMTKHAADRLRQRKIPESLIYEAIARGRRTFLPDRNAVEHRMKNILGLRGVNLVVIVSREGAIITSYVEKASQRRE